MTVKACKDSEEMQKHYPEQYPMRMQSGEYGNEDILTAFLYLLMRDHLPSGVVENMVLEIVLLEHDERFEYTNGWLAQHAAYISERLQNIT